MFDSVYVLYLEILPAGYWSYDTVLCMNDTLQWHYQTIYYRGGGLKYVEAIYKDDLSACELNGRVLFLRPYVGMVYPALPDVKAVLLEGWHSGTLPTATPELQAFCRAARERGVGVYLTGNRDGFAYESKQLFEALGIRTMQPMSPSAAYVYLMLNS